MKTMNSSSAKRLLANNIQALILLSAMGGVFLVLYYAPHNYSGQFVTRFANSSSFCDSNNGSLPRDEEVQDEYYELRKSLKAASTTREKTVILTFLNEAWAAPNSIFDLFLESFRTGNNTARLLKHLLVVSLDNKAHDRCQASVSHCYLLKSNQSSQMAHQANYMTPLYLDLVWEKVAFMQTILTLGYNFLLTDNDIVWFRDPFLHFTSDSDFQVSTDDFNGNEYDLQNMPNVGFVYVRSNNRTIEFYKFWLSSKTLYPGEATQQAFHRIKFDPFTKQIGIKMRFLSPDYFGGFCQPSTDFNKVCTMHANCCVGLDNKIEDLKATLEDWRRYASSSNQSTSVAPSWSVPKKCSSSLLVR